MSIVKVNPKSMAYRLQTVWMRRSIGDPCLFHATLYAASAHLDASRGDHDNPVTLHHHTELVRHVRQRLADPEHKKLDEAIGAVIPLAFFSVSVIPKKSNIVNNRLKQKIILVCSRRLRVFESSPRGVTGNDSRQGRIRPTRVRWASVRTDSSVRKTDFPEFHLVFQLTLVSQLGVL
jgi:hypothetical protein